MTYARRTQAQVLGEIDTEERARAWFWRERFEGKRFVCPSCSEVDSFWQHKRWPEIRQCSVCKHEVRLRAEGLLRDSKLPLLTWVRALVLLTSDKRGVSALTLMRQLGIGSYRTAWLLSHKIRSALKCRDEAYALSGVVELDGSSIGSRSAGNQAPILVAIESRTYVDNKGTTRQKAGFAKAIVGSESTRDAQAFLHAAVAPSALVNTDAKSALLAIKGFDTEHRKMSQDKEELDAWLPHVFRFTENAKVWIAGTFHGVIKKYVGLYLAEYTYRFNRRHDQNSMFHRALLACLRAPPLTRKVLCA